VLLFEHIATEEHTAWKMCEDTAVPYLLSAIFRSRIYCARRYIMCAIALPRLSDYVRNPTIQLRDHASIRRVGLFIC